jgi:L-amino acid N-acyltransferase YncA
MQVRPYVPADLPAMVEIWNQVVEDGVAFPQLDLLTVETGGDFFGQQSYTGVAEEDGQLLGLYILHPNNVGRCGHISNASYAVRRDCRGRHVGRALVEDCLVQGARLGFKLLQFNAVVAANHSAIRLYQSLGFIQIGRVPGGFLMRDGHYEDILLFYHTLGESCG